MQQSNSQLFEKAIAKRQHLLDEDTNAVRLFDGIGDGLRDVFLECFADRWVLSTRDRLLTEGMRNFFEHCGKTVYWKQLDQHQKTDPVHLAGPHQVSHSSRANLGSITRFPSSLVIPKASSSTNARTANESASE